MVPTKSASSVFVLYFHCIRLVFCLFSQFCTLTLFLCFVLFPYFLSFFVFYFTFFCFAFVYTFQRLSVVFCYFTAFAERAHRERRSEANASF
ncbi:hypothetical protein [Blackfly microvirus SF02]|uniref:Uncharacterized protein n=1 Tax=Blackfly microvirus SF02 TaxID=2576452 RepID=A0A4V1F5E7_9VIRU|nr:hypothetical protein [Blackfly microvirus SF02]